MLHEYSVCAFVPLYLLVCLLLFSGRKREWFKIEDARRVLQCHKPVQASYFEALQQDCMTSNGTSLVATYNINQNSLSSIR